MYQGAGGADAEGMSGTGGAYGGAGTGSGGGSGAGPKIEEVD